jgi:hypothetical protein
LSSSQGLAVTPTLRKEVAMRTLVETAAMVVAALIEEAATAK